MIKKRVDALIKLIWSTEQEGGRKRIPKGQFFAANVRFEGNKLLWSIVIFLNNKGPDEMRRQNVEVGFLVRENLEDNLVPGKRVFIYEGPNKLIAEGEILSVNQ